MLKIFKVSKIVLFLLFFLAFGLASFAVAKNDYFPSQDGLTWTYSDGTEKHMSGPYQFDGMAVMVLTHYMNGEIASEEYLIYEENGVFRLGTASYEGELLLHEPPLLVYEGSSLTPGQSWQSKSVKNGVETTLNSKVIGLQGVKTEAGRYNAMIIRQQTFTNTGAQTVRDVYFVPGIGVVRSSDNSGDVVNLISKSF